MKRCTSVYARLCFLLSCQEIDIGDGGLSNVYMLV